MELIEPAKFLGREKELGTIAVGKFADLVLLDAKSIGGHSQHQED
jgi:imidazolonepropionase-like amidohydrolase